MAGIKGDKGEKDKRINFFPRRFRRNTLNFTSNPVAILRKFAPRF